MSNREYFPKVSIIMPCYNSEGHIREAIQSVIDQTFQSWELLICDDASTDASLIIIEHYAKSDSRIRPVVHSKSKGAAGARNSCLNIATGRYIAFLDSDDKWYQHKLETQIAIMSEGAVFSYSAYDLMTEEGNRSGTVVAPPVVDKSRMLFGNFIGCLTAVYDTEYFGKVLQPNMKKRNDYALWLVMFHAHPEAQAVSIPEPLALYRVNSYGLSSNKFDAARYYWLCVRRYGNVGLTASVGLLLCHLVMIAIKKMLPSIYNKVVIRLT